MFYLKIAHRALTESLRVYKEVATEVTIGV